MSGRVWSADGRGLRVRHWRRRPTVHRAAMFGMRGSAVSGTRSVSGGGEKGEHEKMNAERKKEVVEITLEASRWLQIAREHLVENLPGMVVVALEIAADKIVEAKMRMDGCGNT